MNRLMLELKILTKKRDWQNFYSPKNITMALAVETYENMEILKWMTEEQTKIASKNTISKIKDEIACFLIRQRRMD